MPQLQWSLPTHVSNVVQMVASPNDGLLALLDEKGQIFLVDQEGSVELSSSSDNMKNIKWRQFQELFCTTDNSVLTGIFFFLSKCSGLKIINTQPGIRDRVLAVPRPICNGQRQSRTKGQRPDSNAKIDQMSCKEQSERILKLPTSPSNK